MNLDELQRLAEGASVKERPILFSAPMVRALLAGTKTQTRRAVKWRNVAPGLNLAFSGLQAVNQDARGWVLTSMGGSFWQERCAPTPCPYGQSGDRLWVRESWMPDPPDDGTWGYTPWAGVRIGQIAGVPERFRHPAFCNYAANWLHGPVRWTPGIHMPRWASRVLLEITGVRVERLQAISGPDAIAEGICWSDQYDGFHTEDGRHYHGTESRLAYASLWESINGAGSWDANPWVWAVEFRRLTRAAASIGESLSGHGMREGG